MRLHIPRDPRWLLPEARRGWKNQCRADLAELHGSRDWTYKGILTRIFGQGIQRVFKDLPATNNAAITGSMGVAAYDMILHKRDLNWIPNDVDVFIAIPRSRQRYPLRVLYPIMTKWLRSVQAQGFHYKLVAAHYSWGMCVFDFICTNAQEFPKIQLPKISFIGRPARSVRDITRDFDLSICGPILSRSPTSNRIRPAVTYEMYQMFRTHRFWSRVRPDCSFEGSRTRARVKKYKEREFRFFATDYPDPRTRTRRSQGRFSRFPFRCYHQRGPVPRHFIIKNLGREPTKRECIDFNIDT